ncbi:MAG TPA: hypothetical protein VMY39_02565 [Planctomycetota bacterium]|nr:hypothetical protein [Planctomycetota bacterium]
MHRAFALLWLTVVVVWAAPVEAREGLGFQTDVTVSADGRLIATCRNRVIYVLDAKSLKVTGRFWNGAVVMRLCLSRDGSVLAVTDEAWRLRLLNVATGEFFKTVQISTVGFAPAKDLAAATVFRGQPHPYLVLLSIADGSEKARVEVPAGLTPHRTVLSPDGTRAVIMTTPQKGREEELEPGKWPKIEDDVARKEYGLRHDGKTATILALEMPSGKELWRKETWFTSHPDAHELMFFVGDDIYVMQYGNPCARIDSTGKVTLFKSAAYLNYGLGWSASGDVHLCGGLRTGFYCRTGEKPVEFQIPRDDTLPGWPEYFFGFGVTADSTAYGVTSSGRMAEISAGGKLVRIVPFF